MIDIHCHILNSIDDGADSLQETVEMLEIAVNNNIDKIVLTPHIKCSGDILSFIENRDNLFNILQAEIGEKFFPTLYKGAEVYVDEDIFYSNIRPLTINNSRYVLVEFDFYDFKPRRIEKYFSEIFSDGLVPVFAHPERYEYCQQDYGFIKYLSDMGILFQINASSLAGFGSSEEFFTAYEMVKSRIASFIATDAHSPKSRNNAMLRYISAFPQEIDADYLDYMLNKAPLLLLANKEINY